MEVAARSMSAIRRHSFIPPPPKLPPSPRLPYACSPITPSLIVCFRVAQFFAPPLLYFLRRNVRELNGKLASLQDSLPSDLIERQGKCLAGMDNPYIAGAPPINSSRFLNILYITFNFNSNKRYSFQPYFH